MKGSGTEGVEQESRKHRRVLQGSRRKRERRDASPAAQDGGTRGKSTKTHLERSRASANIAGSLEQGRSTELSCKDAELQKETELHEASVRKEAELREELARKEAALRLKEADLSRLEAKLARQGREHEAISIPPSVEKDVLGTSTDELSLWERVKQLLSNYDFCIPTLDSFKPCKVKDNSIHKDKVARSGLKESPHTLCPYMLMHDLDNSLVGDKILTELEPTEGTPIYLFGASGTGKTRALYELLSRQMGFLFIASPDSSANAGAGDVGQILRALDTRLPRINCHYPERRNEASRCYLEHEVTRHLFKCLVVTRCAVFVHIATSDMRDRLTPLSWLIAQLHPRLLAHGRDCFHTVAGLVVNEGPTAVDKLMVLLHQKTRIPVYAALDECQLLMREASSGSFEISRTRLAVALEVLRDCFPKVIASGTGSRITAFEMDTVSQKPKECIPKVALGILDAKKVWEYLDKFLVLRKDSREEEWSLYKLQGRARFAASFVRRVLESKEGSVVEAAQEFETQMATEKVKDMGYWRHSTLYGAMERLETEDRFQHVDVDGQNVKLVAEFKHMATEYMLTGLPQRGPHLELVEVGVCIADKCSSGERCASLCEPCVLTAAINRFKLLEHYEGVILNSEKLPSPLGQQWEKALVIVLHNCFKSLPEGLGNHPLLKGVKLPNKLKGSCSQPTKHLSVGMQHGGELSLLTWLEKCIEAIQLNSQFPSIFFFPENAAGPALVFWLVVGDNKHILVFLQAKLWGQANDEDAYERVIPEACYKRDANKNMQLLDLVRKRAEVQGVCRMVVAYPTVLGDLKTSYPAPKHQDAADDLLIVVTKENAKEFFSPEHMKLFEGSET